MNKIETQIDELIATYPDLKIISEDNDSYTMGGNVFINAECKSIQLADDFDIEIIVPKNFPKTLPLVKEKSGKIPKDFEHIYHDGTLCLAVNAEIKIFVNEIPNLHAWFRKYVVDYFYTVMYVDRYGTFPYGERKHDIEGIIEFYQDFFNERDIFRIYSLLQNVKKQNIKGHNLCPCGSRKKCRYCHYSKLIKLYRN